MKHTDVIIVGGGPAGASAALHLRERGVDCTVIEREPFPRFHIGESLTGEVGAVIRSLGLGDRMATDEHVVKRGVVVYGSSGTSQFNVPVMRINEAGEQEVSYTWQVERARFDEMLLDHAEASGAEIIRGSAQTPLVDEDGNLAGVTVETEPNTIVPIQGSVVVDASGMNCFLHRNDVTGPKRQGSYTRQIAVFSHFRDVPGAQGEEATHTRIFYRKKDHWAWFIPVSGEVVSVGVVIPAKYFRACGESPRDFLCREIRELNPALAERVGEPRPEFEPQVIRNYSYEIEDYIGPNWLCVGDSHRFIDPIFSFGVHLGILEGRKAAEEIMAHLAAGASSDNPFEGFRSWSCSGQEVVQDLLDAFWRQPLAFGYLIHRKHRSDLIDLFAGRIYGIDEPSPGLAALRDLVRLAPAPAG